METWLEGKTSAGKSCSVTGQYHSGEIFNLFYEGWNFNSGNYLFTTDTK